MNSVLTSPAGLSFADQWIDLYLETDSAPSNMPSGNQALSIYAFFETPTHAGSGDPWFFYVSWAASFDQNATVPSSAFPFRDYFARFGYDGATSVQGWWGLKSGLNRPTISFLSYANDPTPILEDHEFIIWIVENSDFRNRYGGGSASLWTNPQIVQNGSSFGWSMPDNNPVSSLAIQRYTASMNNGGWENVFFYSQSPYNGSFTADTSGRYRFVWTYTDAGNVISTFTSNEYSVQISTPSSLGFQDVVLQKTGNGQTFIFAKLTGTPDSVLLQRLVNGNSWETFATLAYGTVNGESGWWWQGSIVDGDTYRLLATQNIPLTTVPYDLGSISGGSSFDVVQYATQLTAWITALITIIPDFFLWMPVEIRTVLFSAIVIMIILGLIGWLKS